MADQREIVTIGEGLVGEMVAHALDGRPNEACGLLSGPSLETPLVVDEVHALTNANPRPDRYLIDAAEHLRTLRAVEGQGRELVGCFHSHIQSPARPSEIDIAQAGYPEWIYVILSLSQQPPDIRAFRIRGGQSTEVKLERTP